MTLNQLIKLLCAKEGKKSQVSVGNVREILKSLKVVCDDKEALKALMGYLLGL